jgi:hypothetical protein
MAHSADGPFDTQGPFDHDEVDTLFTTANPNPERIGCPSKTTLAALARRERDLEDPGYAHLTQCSECYSEFRSLQGQNSSTSADRRSAVWRVSIAAAVLLLLAGAWFYGTRQSPSPAAATPAVVSARVELDLRPYKASRSEQGAGRRPPLGLTRDNLELTMLLPTGAEPGEYDTQLLDASSRVIGSASGRADIRNFVTTLKMRLDLRSTPAGEYRLMVRRQGDDWHGYPAVVR